MLLPTLEYYNSRGGTISSEEAFQIALDKAKLKFDYYTNHRYKGGVHNAPPHLEVAIKNCICDIINKVLNDEDNGNRVLSSRSAGSLSETFSIESSNLNLDNSYSGIIELHLSHLGNNSRWV